METIGKYRIVSELGRGGMGVVYHAHDTVIRRDVAIKVLHEHAVSDSAVERFHREARSAGRLTHDNIMTLYDFGESDGRPYLVMELLDGTDLRPLTRDRRVSLRRKLDILIQIASGLDYAHDNRVIHRDIKPGNIQVLENGRVKIVDFGIARVDSEAGTTMTHASLGTPRYMSPEQIRGEGVDRRSDIFSYGALAYELIAETVPFEGENVTTVMYNVIHKEPRPIRLGDPTIDAEIQSIVSGCLTKDQNDRFPDLRGVINRLTVLTENPRIDQLPIATDDTTVLPHGVSAPRRKPSSAHPEDTVPSFDRSQVPVFPDSPHGPARVDDAGSHREGESPDGRPRDAGSPEGGSRDAGSPADPSPDLRSRDGGSIDGPRSNAAARAEMPRLASSAGSRSTKPALWIAGAALVVITGLVVGKQWLGRPSGSSRAPIEQESTNEPSRDVDRIAAAPEETDARDTGAAETEQDLNPSTTESPSGDMASTEGASDISAPGEPPAGDSGSTGLAQPKTTSARPTEGQSTPEESAKRAANPEATRPATTVPAGTEPTKTQPAKTTSGSASTSATGTGTPSTNAPSSPPARRDEATTNATTGPGTKPPAESPAPTLEDLVRDRSTGVGSSLTDAMKSGQWTQVPPTIRKTYQGFWQALTEDHIIKDARLRTRSLRESNGAIDQEVELEVVQQQKGRDDLMDPVRIPMIWTWILEGDEAIVSQVRP
ncbi:MAG: protein kinase [Candidatus Eisenbacteria bacterium]